jgi:hypothetical protein
MAQYDHRSRVRKAGVSVGHARVEIEGEDISNCFVQVLGLVKECLAVKSRDVLVKVRCEEIQAPSPCPNSGLVVLQSIVEVIGRLGGDGPDLFIAPGIAGDEEYRNTLDLQNVTGNG